MIALLFLGAVTLAGPSVPQADVLDFSCATFHAFLSENDLISAYGSANVTRGPVTGSDDGPIEGTILFPARDDMRVEIAWRDSSAKQDPVWIKVDQSGSRWKLPNGVSIGDDLLTIERRNGRPFHLAGFTSEGHGEIRDWGAGRLATMPNCDISATFQPRNGQQDETLLRQVTRRAQVSSGHPAIQKINPRVTTLWIRHRKPASIEKSEDAILDNLVFGLHMGIDPSGYPADLRMQIQQYVRRAEMYRPRSTPPAAADMQMVYTSQVSYETRLAAISADSDAPRMAQAYVSKLRPCYEWEGFHDCPEREALFADGYQSANPNSPFKDYLPLLSAHRWLCTAEAYEYEQNPEQSKRARTLYQERLSVARQSPAPLVRAAAERLVTRARCLPADGHER